MRIRRLAALAIAAALSIACVGGLFRPYEYEEDVYLSLDGAATVYVNSSVPALDALRGAHLDPSPTARIDRDRVRALYESPVAHVASVSLSRRAGRRFVHVRLDVPDIRRLSEEPMFAWSRYTLRREADRYVYRQSIGASAGGHIAPVGWTGDELVAFRLHLPSRIKDHNAGASNFRRGNILVWQQPLADRLRGAPLTLEAKMETQSILYRTLYLFGATLGAVAILFAGIIAWIMRRGGTPVSKGTPHAV